MADEKKPGTDLAAPVGGSSGRRVGDLAHRSSHVPVFDTDAFDHLARVARMMASAPMIPDHLKGRTELETAGNCFLVAAKALTWNMDPFDVAMTTSVAHGKLCFEGKLIAAVLEGNLGITLDYEWNDAKGDAFGIEVSGPRPKDGKIVSIEGTVGDWKTHEKNSGNVMKQWTGANARRQLAYRGSREWVRLYAPQLLLGVYGPDEIEAEIPMRNVSHGAVVDPAAGAITADFPVEGEEAVEDDVPEIVDAEPAKAEKTPAAAEPEEPKQAKPAAKSPPQPEESDSGDDGREDAAEEDGGAPAASEGDSDAPPFPGDDEPDPQPKTGQAPAGDDKAAKWVQSRLDRIKGFPSTWPEVRAAAGEIFKEKTFASLPEHYADMIRVAIFGKADACEDCPGIGEDVYLFRCWLTTAEDPDVIEDLWEDLAASDQFSKLSEKGQDALGKSVQRRIQALDEETEESESDGETE